MGFVSLFLLAINLVSCSGDDTKDTSEVIANNENKRQVVQGDDIISNPVIHGAIDFDPDSCEKSRPEDWNNFLGIPYGASEFILDSIMGKNNGGTYVNDSLNFVYYYRDVDGAPISIWTNSETTQIEIIYIEIVGINPYFQSDIDKVVERYEIKNCDAKWLGMNQKDVESIMGEPRKEEETEDKTGDKIKNIYYDSEDMKIAVNFRFYESQDYRCSSIMVNWFY